MVELDYIYLLSKWDLQIRAMQNVNFNGIYKIL